MSGDVLELEGHSQMGLKTQQCAGMCGCNNQGLFSVGMFGRMGLRRLSVQSLASGKVEVARSHHFFICLAPAGSVSAQSSHCPEGALMWPFSAFLLIAVMQ